MPSIDIISEERKGDEWFFEVTISEETGMTHLQVSVSKEYWMKLTHGIIKPDELVWNSLEFLLEREPKESIFTEFNISQIQQYFSEYEKEMLARTKK